jgi:multiple sugar transport system ATP-binding protein
MANLELDGVTKVFGDPEEDGVVAVDDLSLEVPDGGFLVLLGPSGCGKTTTLRMIGGLEDLTAGEIKYDGTVVNDVKARNRDVAMVFQDFALYPHMSVRENLGFGLRREDNDMTDAEIEERITETGEMLEIEELLDNRPSQLSGGQKQRVALGRAIIREPRLFLFDEPLANLDAQLRKTMRTEIDELQSQVGITSVYVTHNQEEAMTIADEVAILDAGQLQQLGTPDEVFNEPANLFVAQFVGSPDMNLYEATVDGDKDTYAIDTDAASFSIPAELVDEEIEAEEVLVGFRPQDLFQTRNRSLGGPEVDADVRVVEPVGTEAIIHASTSIGDLTAKVGDFYDVASGQTLSFTVAPEHVYLFDAETGELLKGRLVAERADQPAASGVQA